jgi:outer membrane protein assembly factor BamE (lipoprotein component of BamABCDE complex)
MKRIAVLVMLMAGAGCHKGPAPDIAQYQNRNLFTCCNIHYETDEINDANYYVGTTIPLGTPATIQGATGDSVTFLADGKKLTLQHRYGRDQESMAQYIDKVFVAVDPKTRLAGYSRSAQAAIKEGRVERGMTRDQVLLSLGYPATHKTPSLDAREWTYWYNRWVTFKVAFDDGGKVATVIGRPAPTQDQAIQEDAPPPAPAKAPAKSGKGKAKK